MKIESKTLSPSLALKAAGYASAGIWHALCCEPAFKRIVLGDIILGAALVWYLFPLSRAEAAILVFAAFFPLITEIINTGFEAFVDRLHPEQNDLRSAIQSGVEEAIHRVPADVIACFLCIGTVVRSSER